MKKSDKEKERQIRKQIIASKTLPTPNGADSMSLVRSSCINKSLATKTADIISWDDAPVPSGPVVPSNGGVSASLLDFDLDPSGTLYISAPLPNQDLTPPLPGNPSLLNYCLC